MTKPSENMPGKTTAPSDENSAEKSADAPLDIIRAIVAEDIATGRYDGRVVTRHCRQSTGLKSKILRLRWMGTRTLRPVPPYDGRGCPPPTESRWWVEASEESCNGTARFDVHRRSP